MGVAVKTTLSFFSPVVRRLLDYVRPHSRILVPGLFCAVVVACLTAAYGLLAREVINAINAGEEKHLTRLGLFILVLFVVKGVFAFAQTFLISDAMQKMARDLRNAAYVHIQSLPLRFFEDKRTGQLMSSVTLDVPTIQESLQATLIESITGPIIAVAAIVLMFVMSWQMTLLVVLVVPLYVWIVQAAGKRMRVASRQIQERFQDVSDVLQETIAGVRVIKSFTAEETESNRFREHSQEAHRAVMRSVRVRAALQPTIELISTTSFVLVLWFGGYLITSGQGGFSFGALAGFLVAVNQVGAAGKTIGNIKLTVRRVEAAAERLFRLLDTKSDLLEIPNPVVFDRCRGEVSFERVSFSYTDGTPVLQDVSFEVNPGEAVALVGPSGAGKSTVANLVPRFYDPTGGTVRVDGHDVRTVRIKSLRKNIGIVPQETLLFSGNIRDNIRYGRPEATEDEIREAAMAAHAHAFVLELPAGYDTPVGERGLTLSGGQRQRIAIARAILKNPRILILDEATSSLDTESETAVQDALVSLMKGRTTIMIAHRLSTIRNANRILVLDGGQIVESGTHDELLSSGNMYARLYEMQFRKADSDTPEQGG